MKDKLKVIRKVFKDYNENNFNKLTVFTKGFKAVGEFVKEEHIKDVLCLKSVKVYSYATNCECETTPEYRELLWLNIFSQDIIGFSFHG